jgi:lysyl-tRNA synthetase, class II
MASLEEIRNTRLKKLELLKEKGIDPYPATASPTHTISEVISDFSKYESARTVITLDGRVMSFRAQGALIFFDIYDGEAKFQGLLKKDSSTEKNTEEIFDLFNNAVDVGDFVEITGIVFITKKGQQTLEVSGWRMLSKSLRPLPEKWHGLQDVEERFRRRYLDALMSSEVRDRFVIRSKVISKLRNILDSRGFLEVDTPVLQPLYGGASAEPFVTHHNALDIDLYLRISDELYLKRMLVAGFPKVYEIGRDFRNEGIDMTHNPEFTMIEWYESMSDYRQQMEFVEEIMREIVKEIFNAEQFKTYGNTIDLSSKFKVASYFDLIKELGIDDPKNISIKDLGEKAKSMNVEVTSGDSKQKIIDNIYKKLIRPNIIQPTFIIDYPADYLPLAKRKTDDPYFVEAFQLVIAGVELVKAFSELNDPIDQRLRFEEQEKNLAEGEGDSQRMDVDFIEALEYGMPPAGGVGIGIDRLVMVLTDTKNVKEVIFFPTMRPKD